MKHVDPSEVHRRVIERFKNPDQGVRLLVKAGVLDASGHLTPRHAPVQTETDAAAGRRRGKSQPER